MEPTELKTIDAGQVVTPMSLLQIATEQGADIDKLEKLMEMQMRWDANEAKKAFVTAMSKFRSECPSIVKTRDAHNSKYAGLAETLKQIKQAMESCGLSHTWTTTQDSGVVSVTCNLTHVQGHTESTTLIGEPDKSGSKNNIQAIGSTVTYLQRYTLFSILGIASTDQDDDGNAECDTLDLAEVVALFEGAKALAKLDSLAKHALKLPNDDKAKARLAYETRKGELSE